MPYSITEETINSLLRLFLYLIIFWLPYGSAVVESSVIICFTLWIFKRVFFRHGIFLTRLRPAITPLDRPILFFLVVCFFSATNSVFPLQSLSNFLTKTLEWFVIYFLVVESIVKRKHVYIILGIWLFTLSATVIDSLIQYYVTYRDIFLGHVIEPSTRATAGFKTANGLGAYLTLAIPLILSLIFFRKEIFRYRLLSATIFFFAIWSLVVTFSRGAWLAAFLGAILFFLFFLFHKQLSGFYLVLGFFIITVFLSVYLRFVLTGSFDFESMARHATASWRLNIWRDALIMLEDRPILGHGINTFMQLFEVYRRDIGSGPTYAHNCYIQLAAETGIAGLVSFLWIVFEIFRKSLNYLIFCWEGNDSLVVLSLGLLSGIFAFLIHSFFDNNFYSLQLSVYLWFFVGILIVMLGEIKCQSPNER
ncbi:MAG: hypothetical protein A3D87_03275 [Omnitrophica WOR_2 bacterium RIFCSPHIGHO2_02_FULL_50_17]|nr:MAG: hypothetical protein A3D87_03275 [Omnitrophica WOR_2 bacterium RIFCSPHIGHO2_02_FULL_50_17]